MTSTGTRSVILRKATEQDAERLFFWRNDRLTVQMSLSERRIEWEGHVEWLRHVLASSNRILWIAEDDGKPIGQARADWDADECELSWAAAPEHRQQGYGSAIVMAAVDRVRSSGCEGKVIALIKKENVPSKKIAERAGFDCVSETDNIERWELEI